MSMREEKLHGSKHIVIGIAGTAKNTGKTTTLNCLLKEASRRELAIGVTGIGYDGEELDNVTLLPKPRIKVYTNSIIATSEQCLETAAARVKILHRTGMHTALGEILILRVISEGLIVIAGPGKRSELKIIVREMFNRGAMTVFVDGSLNRIAPMSVVDSIVFTTGGARSTDIAFLNREMHSIESLLRIPVVKRDVFSSSKTLERQLLLTREDTDLLLHSIGEEKSAIYISRLISVPALERLCGSLKKNKGSIQQLIFHDPFMLLMNDDICHVQELISAMERSAVTIAYKYIPLFTCITANPFYPEITGNKFISHFLNREELLKRLQSSCSVPVFNTQTVELSKLFDTCVQ